MNLKEKVYSVLIVSATESYNTALSALLSKRKYAPIQIVSNISAAKRMLAERSYDFVFINSPLPDNVGMRFAIDAGNNKETVVLFMVRAELYDEIYDKIAQHGVFVLSMPTSKAIIDTALSWLLSARERIRAQESKTHSLEEKMAEIKIVNRAKLLLISEMHMDESQAHRYIEKQAMDRCVTRKVVAEEIIKTYS